MNQTCKLCRRVNPSEAAYCYFDGAILVNRPNGTAIDVGGLAFPAPFLFPPGTTCHTMNQLALACWKQPTETLKLLRRRVLERFFIGMGRADLAWSARDAAQAADPERGLDDFLGRLPANVLAAPRLRVDPTMIDLGTLRIGDEPRCELLLYNEGQRLLTGTARCDVSWLALGDGPATRSKLIQLRERMVLPVRVRGTRLRAYGKPQVAQIEVESNGGTIVVVVRVFVPVKPFPEGVLSGALSPRQVALKAKEAPKEAAILIENGALAEWYKFNGWTYPVRGPVASGVAAVQQFLEALGLVKPPQVELSEDAIRLRGQAGTRLEYSLSVITQENRAAIAHATSDQSWLEVGRSIFRGRCAFLPLAVPTVPPRPGETLQAKLSVTANGSQSFVVPVTLEVSMAPVTAPPPAREPTPKSAPVQVPTPPVKETNRPTPKRRTKPRLQRSPVGALPSAPSQAGHGWLVRGLVLLVCAIALGCVMYLGWHLSRGLENHPAPAPAESTPLLTLTFQDNAEDQYVGAATMTFGLTIPRDHKRLVFDERGRSNNVCYRVDGKEFLLGYEGGSWQTLSEPLAADGSRPGCRSVWLHKSVPIAITQTVEIVTGFQSDQQDTCQVRYTIENRDKNSHKVGLRFLLDTFIGSRDGVPFLVTGMDRFCDTFCERKGADCRTFLKPARRTI